MIQMTEHGLLHNVVANREVPLLLKVDGAAGGHATGVGDVNVVLGAPVGVGWHLVHDLHECLVAAV